MGTQEGERDWVDVANDLLSKCHINLRLRKLTDCNAEVFISLYKNIFGEGVPDYIAEACSQEDDAHNVQCVIDSLSLDYLQISLSHITGENVVLGDRESIKNLVEIFDGLLEYLNEEMDGGVQDGVEFGDIVNGDASGETKKQISSDAAELMEALQDRVSSSSESTVHSSKHSFHSCSIEEKGSHAEELELGASARTFTSRQEDLVVTSQTSAAFPNSDAVRTEEASQPEAMPSAIALFPPNQCDGPIVHPQSPSFLTATVRPSQLHSEEEDTSAPAQMSDRPVETIMTNGRQSPVVCQSPAESKKSSSSQRQATAEVEGETLEPTNGGPRRVLFRTQPDVLFLTLQDETIPTTPSPPDTEEEEHDEDLVDTQRLHDKILHRHWKHSREEEGFEESLSYRRQRNKQAEEELHHISEKLSNRLEELDQMLKRVLSESGESNEVKEEDVQSHHSDCIVERSRQHAGNDHEVSQRMCSLSPSPPRVQPSLQRQCEDVREASSPDDKTETSLSPSRPSRHRRSHRNNTKNLRKEAFEEDLKRLEERERVELHVARVKAQEAEREYREAILRDVSQVSRRPSARTKASHKPQRRLDPPRKAPPLRVKENQLLPLLREELPHLYISPHALDRMWEQQMQQVDRLHLLSSRGPRRSKLSSQMEEAQRKHDLLAELVRKDQEHSRRLRDFKERVQQQKSSQNRLREQRQQVARAKKYHSNYHVQHRARLMRARTREERMFRQLFEESLELQKLRLRQQRADTKEEQQKRQQRQQDQIQSIENYYRDQFSLLAEKLAQERQEIQVRKKAQEKALLKMQRELRSRMEREISELQRIINENDKDDHIQDLEVQRLRNRVQLASFQYNTTYLH